MATTNEAAQFWREYEERIGEKILKYALGQYLSGSPEYKGPLWGLAIVTEGGFRFHHFPHENWIAALTRLGGGGGEAPKEKIIVIPKDRIRSYRVVREKSWWRRLLAPTSPKLVIDYVSGGADSGEAALLVEIDRDAEALEAAMRTLVTP